MTSRCIFSQIYFVKELYMFRTDLLSIIGSLNTVYKAAGICHVSYVDCLLARSGYTRIYHDARSKYREGSIFMKIWQEERALYVKSYVYLWLYLAQFFSKRKMFRTKVEEKIKTHILCSVILKKKVLFMRLCGKNVYSRTGHRWQYNTEHAQTPTHTDRHTEYVILIAFPLQRWLSERPSGLCYTYKVCLVDVKPGGT